MKRFSRPTRSCKARTRSSADRQGGDTVGQRGTDDRQRGDDGIAITELDRVNNDLINLPSGVNIPIVMVSRELIIRRFTPLAERVFRLIPTDLGRPISDIRPRLQIDDLSQLLMERSSIRCRPYEGEVQDLDGHWYSLRVRPYITLDNKIDGSTPLFSWTSTRSSGRRRDSVSV